jgi:CPA1 family monovalent cation:H+ antiporter
LLVSKRSPQIFSPQARLQAVHVWDLLILVLNGLVFVLIGLQLKSVIEGVSDYSVGTLMWYAAAVSLATILTRLIWVYPMSRISRLVTRWITGRAEPYPSWAGVTVIGWTGMRGIVSLAAALALTDTLKDGSIFPLRDLTILLTFAVIFATLVLQSLTLPPLIRAFGESVSKEGEHEELIARLMTANAAIERLGAISDQATGTPVADSAGRIRTAYMNRVDHATSALTGTGLHNQPESATTFDIIADGRSTPDDSIRLQAIAAERNALIELRDKGEISEEAFRRIERDLDLEETRLA